MRTVIYAFKTNNNNYSEIFSEGICFFDRNFSLDKSLVRITSENNDEFLLRLKKDEVAYFITIPERYMEVKECEDSLYPPFPILFERIADDPKNRIADFFPVIIPCLISGMYDSSLDYVENPDYSYSYNPCGLKYSKEQLTTVRDRMDAKMYDSLSERNKKDSVDLYKEESKDFDSSSWKPVMKAHKVESIKMPFAKKGNLPDVVFSEGNNKSKKLKSNKKNKKYKE